MRVKLLKLSMASPAPEQLWTAPRAAKEREILFEAIANGSVVSWQDISPWGIRFLGRKAPGFGPNRPKIGCLKSFDFGSSEKTYLVVYIRFVVNRVAFYVPLLEEPLFTGRFSCLNIFLPGKTLRAPWRAPLLTTSEAIAEDNFRRVAKRSGPVD